MLNCVIIEDEFPAREELKYFINNNNNFQINKEFENPIDALKYIEGNNIDVVFLDINMPELDGMSLGKIIHRFNKNIKLVFITAYKDFAIDAFEIKAFDYILKPYSEERIIKVLNNLVEELNKNDNENLIKEREAIVNKLKELLIDDKEKNENDIEKLLKAIETQVENLKGKITDLQNENNEIRNELNEYKNSEESNDSKLIEAENNLERLIAEFDEYKNLINEKYHDINSKVINTKNQLNTFTENCKDLLQKYKQNLIVVEKKLTELKNKLESIKEKNEASNVELTKQKSEFEDQLKVKEEESKSLNDELEKIRLELATIKKAQTLEESKAISNEDGNKLS